MNKIQVEHIRFSYYVNNLFDIHKLENSYLDRIFLDKLVEDMYVDRQLVLYNSRIVH